MPSLPTYLSGKEGMMHVGLYLKKARFWLFSLFDLWIDLVWLAAVFQRDVWSQVTWDMHPGGCWFVKKRIIGQDGNTLWSFTFELPCYEWVKLRAGPACHFIYFTRVRAGWHLSRGKFFVKFQLYKNLKAQPEIWKLIKPRTGVIIHFHRFFLGNMKRLYFILMTSVTTH